MTQLNQGVIGVLALLAVRGCPDEGLEHAVEWLMRRRIPQDMAQLLADVDEAIAVATAMTTTD
jgi:hypothetical protein